MSRRTRKRMIGKRAENTAIKETDRLISTLQRLVRREWWSERRGQIPASEILPLCPCERQRRKRARQEFLALDPFEHREE